MYWGLSLVGAGVFNHLAIVGQAAWRKQLNLASELGDLAHGLGQAIVIAPGAYTLDLDELPSRR